MTNANENVSTGVSGKYEVNTDPGTKELMEQAFVEVMNQVENEGIGVGDTQQGGSIAPVTRWCNASKPAKFGPNRWQRCRTWQQRYARD